MEELIDKLSRDLSCPAVLGRTLKEACDSGLIAAHFNSLVTRLAQGDEAHLRQASARSMVLAQRDNTVLQVRRIGGAPTHVDRLSEAERYVHTAPSNAAFDASLRARNAAWGVRDVSDVDGLARLHGFTLQVTIAMPANNLSVVWRRTR